MCVISISRGSFSGAKALAEGVAERLDVPCVSREILAEAATTAGIAEGALAEVLARPPSFFERLSRERETYLAFIRAALYRRAAEGSFVYHGHGGHRLMADLHNLLRLRVVAPLEIRIEAVKASLGLEEREARRHITKIDSQRAKWVKFLYGVEWTDPQSYDLIVNLEKLDSESAVDLVEDVARSAPFAWTEANRRRARNLALSSGVAAEMARIPESRGVGLEIEAEDGVVRLGGTTQYDVLRQAIVEAAARVPGVNEIRNEIRLRSDAFKS